MLHTPNTIATLISVLNSSSPPQLLLPSLRTLTSLLTARPPSQSLIISYPNLSRSITSLLKHFSGRVPIMGIDNSVVTSLCLLLPVLAPNHSNAQATLNDALALPLSMLVRDILLCTPEPFSQADTRLLSSAILAISHIMSPATANKVSQAAPDFVRLLIKLLRTRDATTRLAACALITSFYSAAQPDVIDHVTRVPQNNEIAILLVPTLMKLFDDALAVDDGRGCNPLVLHTLAVVCREGGEVADCCVEVGLIKKVVKIIAQVAPSTHSALRIGKAESRLLAGGLLCLSALGLHKEEYRKAIIEANALTVVVAVMSTENAPSVREIKIAACNVLRSLSRSVVLLRTSLVESGIVDGVVDLLGDVAITAESEPAAFSSSMKQLLEAASDNSTESAPISDVKSVTANNSGSDSKVSADEIENEIENEDSLEVRTAAMAAVCNLVLEFSPLRKPILDQGILPVIVAGARSRYIPLRLNSVWALKHMVYGDDMQTKGLVLQEAGFPLLMKLCNDPEIQVQEQALDFIRNLIARSDNYIDKLFDSVGVDTLFELLDRKLSMRPLNTDEDSQSDDALLTTEPYYTEIVVAAAYILVHIAAGCDHHRQTIISHESVLKKVITLMAHERDEVRLACLWIILNLTWIEEPPRTNSSDDLMMAIDDTATGSSAASPSSTQAFYLDVYKKRAFTLVRLGVRERLAALKNDRVLDVREKTKTAIYQIDSLTGEVSDTLDTERGENEELGVEVMEVDSASVVRNAYMYTDAPASSAAEIE